MARCSGSGGIERKLLPTCSGSHAASWSVSQRVQPVDVGPIQQAIGQVHSECTQWWVEEEDLACANTVETCRATSQGMTQFPTAHRPPEGSNDAVDTLRLIVQYQRPSRLNVFEPT